MPMVYPQHRRRRVTAQPELDLPGHSFDTCAFAERGQARAMKRHMPRFVAQNQRVHRAHRGITDARRSTR